MENVFEDYFSEYQADMISICMEYVDYREEVETVFVYASWENGWRGCGVFFKVNGKIVSRGNGLMYALQDKGYSLDVSSQRQRSMLDILNEDHIKINEVCKKFGREMPTEMKLIYDVKSGQFSADYQYDLVRTKDIDNLVTVGEAEDIWMAEEAAKLGQYIEL